MLITAFGHLNWAIIGRLPSLFVTQFSSALWSIPFVVGLSLPQSPVIAPIHRLLRTCGLSARHLFILGHVSSFTISWNGLGVSLESHCLSTLCFLGVLSPPDWIRTNTSRHLTSILPLNYWY